MDNHDNRICGVHAVYEALASKHVPIERIHIAREAHSGKLKEILDLAHEREVPIRKEERAVLDRMAEGVVHQGIIAVTAALSYSDFEVLFKAEKPVVGEYVPQQLSSPPIGIGSVTENTTRNFDPSRYRETGGRE